MAERIVSIFGTYDFFAKSLPGVTFVLAILPLLPEGSIPIPSLTENFLVFVSLLVSVFVAGTLLGEMIHSLAQYFESAIAWVGRRLRNSLLMFIDKEDVERLLSPISEAQVGELKGSTESGNQGLDTGERPTSEDTEQSTWEALIQNWTANTLSWAHSRYTELVYVLWDHRSIFKHRITHRIGFPVEPEDPTTWGSFTQQHLIKHAVEEYKIKSEDEADSVYSVINSALDGEKGKADTFQARYSFCRSMGMIGFVSAFSYLSGLFIPTPWTIDALAYEPYLYEISPDQIILVSALLIAAGCVFLLTAGAYKRTYLEYLMADFYVYTELKE